MAGDLSSSFNLTGNGTLTPMTITQLEQQFGATTVTVLALTVINFFAAVLTVILVLCDNFRLNRTLSLDRSRRLPFTAALGVVVSHTVFLLKDLNWLKWWDLLQNGAGGLVDNSQGVHSACMIYGQLGFWGMSNAGLC
jgi:hypothetical protein